MQQDGGNTKPKPPKRQPDAVTTLFDGELVDARALAEILKVSPAKILAWSRLPGGLPYIRVPSGDPERDGLRRLYNVAKSRAWLEGHEVQPNPPRKARERVARQSKGGQA